MTITNHSAVMPTLPIRFTEKICTYLQNQYLRLMYNRLRNRHCVDIVSEAYSTYSSISLGDPLRVLKSLKTFFRTGILRILI